MSLRSNANGAFSGAFVYLFNHEWRVSASVSGGVGAGGTIEKGYALIHDSNQPWYKGWHLVKFTTKGLGAYSDASASVELNFGWSKANNIKEFLGGNSSATVGGSYDLPIALSPSVGYEETFTNQGVNLHNISLGISWAPQGIQNPVETHLYQVSTVGKKIW